ncbi:AAA-like domain-containing protein [Calothrix sp. 336/3]|uniref:WD40 domain-containing protein n=1 Tax=Calothrix sp. 336/3 TaxID=1337936 RepID=UPI0004E38E6B|nr:AAA-like domain-containing protein [Calothrix sp. 336/3]AKG21309.1 hypothetical protein IJ00_08345 [Calothrix sp. 336/3]
MNPASGKGYEYQVGGSLPIHAPTYVRRQADDNFYQSLKKGEFCYVLNSRQMGKSSLRVQTMQRLEEEGFACAAVDITAIGTADITPIEWYAGMIDYLVGCFDLDSDFELKSWWQENALLSPVQHFSKFIETILLERVEQNIIIFIDEIDSILSLQFNLDDFFAVIRDCYNRRASQPTYNRLTFALLGVSTPSDLIQNWKRTPFNIGQAIDLTGFQLSEVEPLAKGLTRLGNSQELIKAVIYWTGGQPFLTQRICRLLLSEIGEEADKPFNYVEKLVQQRIIDNWEAQDEPEHLKTIRDRILLGFEKGKGRLLGLCQQILGSNQEGIIADDSPEQTQLRLTGLVVRRDGKLKIYNRIYESVFNLAWVGQELAKLRPYSDAFDAWMASEREDESRLLRGQALQDALLWASDKGLSDEDNRFLRASQEFANREVAIALDAERQAKEILAAAQAKAELALDEERQANQRLTEAQRKTQRQVRVGTGILAVSIIGAIAASMVAGKAIQEQSYALTATRLERDGVNILRQFQGGGREIASLQLAIQLGRELKGLAKDKKSLADYPAHSPVFSLQEILRNIRERNRFQVDTELYLATLSPDGKTLAFTNEEKDVIKLSNATTGKEITTLSGHKDVSSVAFSPDGKTLASGSWNKTIKLWNVTTGKEITSLTGHKDYVSSVAFSPDGKTLVSTSSDHIVKLWNVATGKEIASLTGHQGSVNSAAFSPDGKTLASGSDDKTIKLWNVATGKEIASLIWHQYEDKRIADQSKVMKVAFARDGETLVSVSSSGVIKLFYVSTLEEFVSLNEYKYYDSVVSSPNGKTLAFKKRESDIITLFNTGTFKEIDWIVHQDWVNSVAFSPDGKTLVSTSRDKTIRLSNVSTYQEIATLTGHGIDFGYNVYSVTFSPDGKTLASVSIDRTVKLWNVATGKEIASLTARQESVNSVAFSPDGKTLASASENGSDYKKIIKLWNVATGKEIDSLTGHKNSVSSVTFSPDGKTIASGSWDKTIKLWNVTTGKEITSLSGHQDSVNSVAFSPDGKTLASCSNDKTIKLWNVTTGKEITSLSGHQDSVNSVAFSPDGKTLASGSNDRTTKLWNATTGKEISSLTGHQYEVVSVAFSPDGKILAAASSGKIVKLWNVGTAKEIASLTGHQDSVNSIAFSPDGKILASGGSGTIQLWSLNLDDLLAQGCRYLKDYFASHPNEKKDLCP